VEAVKSIKIAMAKALYSKVLTKSIEHTLLKPQTSKQDVEKLCNEAEQYGFHAVCVPPYFVSLARQLLKNSAVKVVTVAGFPMGYTNMNGKGEETKKAISDGADEIDMVMNIAAFKSGNFAYVKDDIQNIATLCRLHNKIVKVILETSILSYEEIEKACAICAEAEVDFVKTSTGFTGEGANVEVVRFMRSILPPKIKIKASGGIKTNDFALELLEAGAIRIGTSAGVEIIESL
jgi:deoxyribose-phosphate aldolase